MAIMLNSHNCSQLANEMKSRLKEEIRVNALLEQALLTKEINTLKSAVMATSALQPVFEPPYFHQATALITQLELQMEIRVGLIKAMDTKKSWMDRDKMSNTKSTIR
jgi:hypothetical protein